MDSQAIASQMTELLRKEAVQFLEGHAADVLALGEETVKAILSASVYAKIGIPILPSNATMEMIAQHESALLEKDRVLQLVAAAQLKDVQRVLKLRSSAGAVAARVASGLAVVGLTLLKGALGG